MADMYPPKDRGKSLAIVGLLPYLGPALGPIVGGLIAERVHWPWIFWMMSIFASVVTVLGIVFIRESYTPVLLRRKAALESGQKSRDPSTVPSTAGCRGFFSRLATGLYRPLRLMVTRPVIQFIAVVNAVGFGIYAFMLSTFATLWIEQYKQSKTTSSLHYIAIALGTTGASQIGGRVLDWVYRRLSDRNNGEGKPEFRAPFLIPGVMMAPIGLFWYGWAAEKTLSWPVVDLGAMIFTLGDFMLGQGMLTYQLDEFAEYGASANAASRMLSNILAFAFPIFGPKLYGALGYGWGNTLMGFIAMVVGCPVPWIIWVWGAKLRALGRKQSE
jgi:MFS family permease